MQRFLQGFLLLTSFSFSNAFANSVTLSTLEWEPYIGKNVNGKGDKGYVYDIVKAAFEASGYSVDIQFFPWARAVSNAETGKHDGVFPEYNVETTWGQLSSPFPGGPIGLYKRKELKVAYKVSPQEPTQTEALKGLKTYKFGVVKGYTNTESFDKADFLKKSEATSDSQNLKKLHSKRVDLVVIDKFVARALLGTPELQSISDDLEFMEPALEDKSLFINFSKNAPDYEKKLAAFNQGLASIIADGKLNAILAKYGF